MNVILRAVAAAWVVLAAATPVVCDASVLWVGESKGVIKLATTDGSVLFEIPGEGVSELAVDDLNGRLWTYGDKRLKAYSSGGALRASVRLPNLRRRAGRAVMVVAADGLWFAAANRLYKFDH
ncbi:MAG: hypothetical protein KatS3mg121_0271 [Gammaproteobacteria bacterium]|nr:MAG: hypothetical protein KatS3mg121_0271 [Gammaproteobacteria bacterium]